MKDGRLPTDDDIASSDSEAEQDDVASGENIVSGSGSYDNGTFIVGLSHDLKIYFMR